ncbi:FAD-dependent oxidoreductase [soil metagenome]
MPDSPRIIIIGAGPCGLGAGRELSRHGYDNYTIYERAGHAGGLASSVVDAAGFTWDHGGHVVFSHFGEFDRILEEAMGDEVYEHDRSSYIRFDDRWVPYPFQNNLRHLPPPIALECVMGLIAAEGGDPTMDFAEWMQKLFGEGITKHFMRPYNFKVWATPAERMSSQWIGERVSVVDYTAALKNLVLGEDNISWGPNNRFVFPAEGATGEIYLRLAKRLDDHIVYNTEIVKVDAQQKTVRFKDGHEETYDTLISTMPLDKLVHRIEHAPEQLWEAAGYLEHNSVYMVGIGYETPLKDDKSWLYFPQDHAPFYRATNFAKYSPANVPDADTGRYCSYMTEVSHSKYKHEERAGLEERVEAGLRAAGVIEGRPEVASAHVVNIDYAYPVPTVKRDEALRTIQPWLMSNGIYSRGRFGAWRYEAGNMDHSVKMGVDTARFVVDDTPEELWIL